MKRPNIHNAELVGLCGILAVAIAFYACLPPKQFPTPEPPKQFVTDPASFPESFDEAERDRHLQLRDRNAPPAVLLLWIRDEAGVVRSWGDWLAHTGREPRSQYTFSVSDLPDGCEAIYSPTKP